jgi:hypothetical protein
VKTTIELPDALLHKAKIVAAQRRTSLKALIEQGLECVLHGSPVASSQGSSKTGHGEYFEVDEFNVPVLKRRGVKVTDEWVDSVRNEEDI